MKNALAKEQSRRLVRIEVSPELLLDLLKVPPEGTVVDGRLLTVSKNAIPTTATVHNCSVDECGVINLVISDESFDELASTDVVPVRTPYYTQHQAGAELMDGWRRLINEQLEDIAMVLKEVHKYAMRIR